MSGCRSVPQQIGAQTVQLAYAPMASIEDFQPVQPIRRPRQHLGSGCFRLLLRAAVGFFGGAAVVIAALFVLNALFPPPRLNILLLGLDQRPGETSAARADTMILATIDPDGPYAGILSIPRDLWVTLPDGSPNRINTAHFYAEAASPGTGPEAALKTVTSNFGLTLDRYLRIDFEGFVTIIDSVGGITVNVESPIVDYEYPDAQYGYEVLTFEAGEQHMDGERALQYARTRHGSSDFGRAKRQQAILAALGRRLLQPDAWPRLPLLYLAIQSSVDTNLTPLEIIRVLPTLIAVGPDGIDWRVIEGAMVQPYTTTGGASVQMPVWEQINPALLEMFGE